MGLFDHLFKTKAPTGGEKVGEHASEGNVVKPVEAAPKTPLPQKEKANPSAFLHPKNYVPRGASSLTPAPRPTASSVISKTAERRPAVGGPPPAADEIVLTLGDVLSRIPTPYLKPGAHDAKRELRFKINDLSSDIARGRAAVPLSRIAHLVPDIFTKEITREEDTEIRLPLQKLVEQIGLLRSRPKTSVVEKIARPVTAAELPPAAEPVVPIEVTTELLSTPSAGPVPAAERSVLDPLTPAATVPPQTPPIILSEPVVAPKTVELKATAEPSPAAAPVVLGPPATVEAPTAPAAFAPAPPAAETPVLVPALAPVPPVAELPLPVPVPAHVAPVPEPPVLEAKLEAELVKPAPAPEPESAPEPMNPVPVEPVMPVEPASPQKIVIDWGAEVFSKEEDNKESKEAVADDVVAGTSRIESLAAEGPKLVPVESPDIEPDEEKIHLSLAAILRQCPHEILVGEMPHVDDSVRITLPFAPIDRQLVKGQVEVSALRFIVALPEVYQKFFVAKVGVKVPIPLEEVFQNLPAPKQELVPQPPTPPPVVLAPAASVPVPEAVPAAEKPEQPSVAAESMIQTAAPEPAVVEAKVPEAVDAPVEPPLPVVAPVEISKGETPAAPAAFEGERPVAVAPAVSVAPVDPSTQLPLPVIPPIIDVPEAATAERLAQPPLPTPVEIAGSIAEPAPVAAVAASAMTEATQGAPAGFVPPWLSVEPAPAAGQEVPLAEVPAAPIVAPSEVPPISFAPTPQEGQPAAPVAEPVPPPAPITSAEVSAAPSEDAPRLQLQRPVFRPRFVPPPPIFGFTPQAAAPEPEPVSKPEPPSVLAGWTEAATRESESALAFESAAPATEAAASEMRVEVAPIGEPLEEKSAPASEAEPTVEMMALAGEHDAPDIAHFSGELVPFADLAETLAHETTYASELAEFVHVDLPVSESVQVKAPVPAELVAEQPPFAGKPVVAAKTEETEEHRAVPIVEGLAAAAVSATIAEHVPLDFRGMVAPAEEPKASEEVAAPAAAPAAEAAAKAEELQPAAIVEEPKVPEAFKKPKAVESSAEPATLAAEKIEESSAAPVGETSVESPASQTPAVLTPEPPVATVLPPLPHPLFPVPKVHSEPTHVEVLPPPSLPLRRFDQDAIQALFMTEETLDLPKISRLAAALPGVYACVIATRDQACTGGNLPEGFDLAALLGLAPRVGEAAGRMPIGQLKHFTLYGDAYSVSFFERNGLSLCAVHRPRSFVPGVREKLVSLADELSR